jgi:phasin family protein
MQHGLDKPDFPLYIALQYVKVCIFALYNQEENFMQNPYNDMMKMWSQFKMPSLDNLPKMGQMPAMDMNSVVSNAKRNVEACSSAAQCVTEGAQTVARRQAELARASVEKLLKTTKDMLVNGSPEINTSKQAEFAKAMIEQCMSNLREVSELCTKSGFEAFDVLNKRAAESFEEISRFSKAA